MATETLTITGQGSRVFTNTRRSGEGGEISVSARDIQLVDGATISAQSSGMGDAGAIAIEITHPFRSGPSSVTTAAPEASGGRIMIPGGQLIRLRHSELSARVQGDAQPVGGNELRRSTPQPWNDPFALAPD